MRLIITALIGYIYIFSFNCFAQGCSLRTLAGVKVNCAISPDLRHAGLENKYFQDYIELILKQKNIKVLQKYNDKTQNGELKITADGFYLFSDDGKIDRYFCIVTLSINESATLLRDNTGPNQSKINFVQTWTTNHAVSGHIKNMKITSIQAAASVVEVFSKKYLEDNQL